MAKGKKDSSDKKYDFERETRVLLEKIHSEVKTVAEGHSTIVNKLNEHDKRFNTVESELDTVKMAVMDTNQTVKSIEKKLDNHEERISKLEEKVHA
jgi:uncharacterized coiled-coil DUF342 family protein